MKYQELGIPLKFEKILADEIDSTADLISKLQKIEQNDNDALLCFNHGVVRGEYKPFSGHVAVFDKVVEDKIHLVDASPNQPNRPLASSQPAQNRLMVFADDH